MVNLIEHVILPDLSTNHPRSSTAKRQPSKLLGEDHQFARGKKKSIAEGFPDTRYRAKTKCEKSGVLSAFFSHSLLPAVATVPHTTRHASSREGANNAEAAGPHRGSACSVSNGREVPPPRRLRLVLLRAHCFSSLPLRIARHRLPPRIL
jgi:hypothetical protein